MSAESLKAFKKDVAEGVRKTKYTNVYGNYHINRLFIELSANRPEDAIYSLSAQDHPSGKYTNLHKAYLQMEDPTEWEFAQKYFANWEHWQLCLKNEKILEYVTRWREELQLMLQSRALKEIVQVSMEGGNRSFEANKFLVQGGWIKKDGKGVNTTLPASDPNGKPKRGRPSTESVRQKALAEFIEGAERIDDDFSRLLEYKKN